MDVEVKRYGEFKFYPEPSPEDRDELIAEIEAEIEPRIKLIQDMIRHGEKREANKAKKIVAASPPKPRTGCIPPFARRQIYSALRGFVWPR